LRPPQHAVTFRKRFPLKNKSVHNVPKKIVPLGGIPHSPNLIFEIFFPQNRKLSVLLILGHFSNDETRPEGPSFAGVGDGAGLTRITCPFNFLFTHRCRDGPSPARACLSPRNQAPGETQILVRGRSEKVWSPEGLKSVQRDLTPGRPHTLAAKTQSNNRTAPRTPINGKVREKDIPRGGMENRHERCCGG